MLYEGSAGDIKPYVTGFAKRGLPHTSKYSNFDSVLYKLAISSFDTMFLYVSTYCFQTFKYLTHSQHKLCLVECV